jgi:signal transduction histidine kinase
MLKQISDSQTLIGSADPTARPGPLTAEYWLVGAAFVALYLIVERSTLLYELDGLGITLWSPAAGLSLTLLLQKGLQFTPAIFAASLAGQALVYTGPRGPLAMIGTSLVLALGLFFTAAACRKFSKADPRHVTLGDIHALLVVAPLGALLMALAYCAVLYATGVLYGWRFFIAVRNDWIGNTLGMVTLAPAIPALLSPGWLNRKPSRTQLLGIAGFFAALGAALWVIFGIQSVNEYQFFYLLFLPIIWVAVRAGYAAVAVALFVTHLALVTVAIWLGYPAYDFMGFQMLMLVLSATGLLLGGVVTERRRSEEKLRQQQGELARAVRHATVGAMGAALAHEISQPMSSAANYLHAARRILRATADANGPVAQALAKSEAEAQRARLALERVRDYVSSGRIESTEIDIEALVRKIVALVGRDAEARGVTIAVTSNPHLPRLRADPVQIELLLVNLITNAIDAASSTNASGRVVTLQASQCADRIALAVSDNGPGIASAVADRIFEPFETTKRGGMGLGLTVARQIVEAHGGTLTWLRRQPQGVQFTAELPLDGPAPHAA